MAYVAEAGQSTSQADADAAADERYLVPALVRGLSILSTLSGANSNPTLSEVAASLGVTRSSAYRLLYTLGHLGFVDYDARGQNLCARAAGAGARLRLSGVARHHAKWRCRILMRLRDRTGWSAHLGELHGREVVYLARVADPPSVASTVHVGTRLPAHATTMGRILLSGLSDEDIREHYQEDIARPLDLAPFSGVAELLEQIAADRVNGFVVQNSGYEPGVASVAAPIRDMTNRIVGRNQRFGGGAADFRRPNSTAR